ncbi:hypothetical protein A3A95_04095 [Candidatus Nomurabacteria bacterium RIFCSPLOWO2_01_FULL_39_18]|uniref:Uncharacterized protein n=1 Tax=Candidatus Nomurabacteria bacterium RIFCSPHIGHO2_01_FULL_40_24b TaxID=1801739 RepID=A0A1F6V6P5_9BACT|nr:MAG: hypothetical protein A2647_04425 [Candidatus Nomurabacteria bacterium RIFCSPHIGHO2_01_FULL_40_24b]OGI89282.1 MAG: hypothetical protein A3A95_04095 [Candidatus Nomurabacteria bacterium RIFCSPLOWO2_01_FULL_39_18]
MENQNKWNKELLYSVIFLVAAFLWFTFNPFSQIRDLTNGIYSVLSVMAVGFYVFTLLSLYCGLKAARRATREHRRDLLVFSSIVVLASAALAIFITLFLTGAIKY